MKCSNHINDHSSSIGICASCLRERLFPLIALHDEAQSVPEDCRRSDAHPKYLAFPRSVSPYISHRNRYSFSDSRSYSNSHLDSGDRIEGTTTITSKKKNKFSLFSNIFRSGSGKSDSKLKSAISASDSTTWFLFKKKQSRMFAMQDSTADASPSTTGFSEIWKSPACVQPNRSSYLRSGSSLAFCLSPLVRANPSVQWRKKTMPPEFACSGDSRVCNRPHASVAAFCASRSRKIANIGRPRSPH